MKKLLLDEDELIPFMPQDSGKMIGKTAPTFSDRLVALREQQKTYWPLLKENLETLSENKRRDFSLNGSLAIVQNNPKRIKSTTAKVDDESINNRECFLCEANLLPGQRAVRYYKDYNILCNPYPIISEHYTIAKTEHTPQEIKNHLNDMLLLTRDIGDRFAVFYNGPQCGASAPDHLHFQAVKKQALPIFKELIENEKIAVSKIVLTKKISVSSAYNSYRHFIKIVSNNSVEILNLFSVIYKGLLTAFNTKDEPMMNIVCFYEDRKWNLIIIPRKKHRPDYYYNEGDGQILISPASIDICGLLVAPREEDLDKVTPEIISDIFKQVCLPREIMEYLASKIKAFYE